MVADEWHTIQCFAIVLSPFESHVIDCCLSQSIVICEYDAIISRKAILLRSVFYVWPPQKQMWTQSNLDGINSAHTSGQMPWHASNSAVLAENSIFHFDGQQVINNEHVLVMRHEKKNNVRRFLTFFPLFVVQCFRHFLVSVWNKVSNESHYMYWLVTACIRNCIEIGFAFDFFSFLLSVSPNRLLNFVRRFGRYTCDIYTETYWAIAAATR